MAIFLTILFFVGVVLGVVASVMLLIAAFRVHIGWGLAVLFLGPAALVFLIMHWHDAKRAFLVQVIAVLLMGSSISVAVLTGVSNGPTPGGTSSLSKIVANVPGMPRVPEGGDGGEPATGWLDSLLPATGNEEEAPADDPVTSDPRNMPGRTIQEAREIFGRERGRLSHDGMTAYMFDGFTLVSKDGETIVDVELLSDSAPPPSGVESPARPSARAARNAEPVKVIAQGGKAIDMKQVLVPGKVTIVDFYADWCGPCRQMAPQLEALAREDGDVVLRKVDIVRWETEVARQYRIQSIPNVRVYSAKGNMVGQPTADINKIRRYIDSAKTAG